MARPPVAGPSQLTGDALGHGAEEAFKKVEADAEWRP